MVKRNYLDGKRADLKCWLGPWSDPVRIRVTAIDMMQSGQKSDELFNIRYKIDQITGKYYDHDHQKY